MDSCTITGNRRLAESVAISSGRTLSGMSLVERDAPTQSLLITDKSGRDVERSPELSTSAGDGVGLSERLRLPKRTNSGHRRGALWPRQARNRLLGWLVLALFVSAPSAIAAEPATRTDEEAIRAAALDYIEGWYEGDAARMERSLHPDLVKRLVERKSGAADHLDELTAAALVRATGNGGGKGTPEEKRRTEVKILDLFRGTASVRVDAGEWIDYMHVARWNGEWKIVNVLWETR
jgi:hypothetical protein